MEARREKLGTMSTKDEGKERVKKKTKTKKTCVAGTELIKQRININL